MGTVPYVDFSGSCPEFKVYKGIESKGMFGRKKIKWTFFAFIEVIRFNHTNPHESPEWEDILKIAKTKLKLLIDNESRARILKKNAEEFNNHSPVYLNHAGDKIGKPVSESE